MATKATVPCKSHEPIPNTVLRSLKGLPERVDQLLGPPSGGRRGKSNVADYQDLHDELSIAFGYLSKLRKPASATACDALLSLRGGAVGVALLRLLAAALREFLPGQGGKPGPAAPQASSRRSRPTPRTPVWMKVACQAADTAALISCSGTQSPAKAAFLRKLFAMGTLQASARQLAAAADLMGGHLKQPTKNQVIDAACVALRTASAVICSAALHQHETACEHVDLGEVTALRNSGIFEHGARVAMLLPDDHHYMYALETFLGIYVAIATRAYGSILPATPQQVQLAAAASGPCMDYLAMSLGLAALCAADGGPWYGLPEEMRERLPVIHYCKRVLLQDGEKGHISPNVVKALAAAVTHRARSRQLSLRTAVSVLLRLCRLGEASMQSARGLADCAASGGKADGGSESGGDGRVGPSGSGAASPEQRPAAADAAAAAAYIAEPVHLLSLLGGADLVAFCLLAMRGLLSGRPAAWADVRDEWWRAAVSLCRLPKSTEQWKKDAACPALLQLPQMGTIPLVPPPDLAAALAAGLLPALERLMRRAGEDLGGPAAEVLGEMASLLRAQHMAGDTCLRFLTPLLAHGDPRQAAALVASFGKSLRRPWQDVQSCTIDLAGLFLREVASVLAATARPEPSPPGTEPAPAPQLLPQLRMLLGCLLREWLPVLSNWTAEKIAAGMDVGPVLQPLLWSIRVLAAAEWNGGPTLKAGSGAGSSAGPEPCQHSSLDGGDDGGQRSVSHSSHNGCNGEWSEFGTSSGGGGGVGRGDPGSDGFGHVLRRQMRPLRLLGHTLTILEVDAGVTLDTAETCLALTAACPDALRTNVQRTREAASALLSLVGPNGSRRSGPAVYATPWPPPNLRRLMPALRKQGARGEAAVVGLEALIQLMDLWASDDSGPGAAAAEEALLEEVRAPVAGLLDSLAPLARLLGPPVAASSLLGGPTCANPLCASLKGDSELDVRLQLCGRCGAVGYCCRACQTAHWRAGHKEECSPPGAASGGMEAQEAGKQQP